MPYAEHIAKTGKLYYRTCGSGVTASSTYLFANFEGNIVFDIAFTEVESLQNDVVVKDTAVTRVDYGMTIERVHFNAQKLWDDMYGITGTAGSILNTAAPTATIWEFTTATEPTTNEFLISYIRDDDDETNQLKIMRASIPALNVPMGVADWVTYNLTFRIFQNSNGTVMRFYGQTA